MDDLAVLAELVETAGLPPVAYTAPVTGQGHGYGLDNELLGAELADGRMVLLRRSKHRGPSPLARAGFLAAHSVGAPRVYAATDGGDVLVDYVTGDLLADLVDARSADGHAWSLVGAALARVHAVAFPAPLQGQFGPETLSLVPLDPLTQLQSKLEHAVVRLGAERPRLLFALDRLHGLLIRNGARVRAERPCLVHGDINLLNIVVGPDRATLIDWDVPAVAYPLAELSALDEHVYLHGATGLPQAFFAGYGRHVPRDLLRLYRAVGCINWLASDDWSDWQADPSLPLSARHRLHDWHEKLLAWVEELPRHLPG